jgi:hypothetical protein
MRGAVRHSRAVDWVAELTRGARRRAGWLAAVGVVALMAPAGVRGAVPADVAVVAGTPIARPVLDHWMFVSVKTDSDPDEPLVVPTDPPRFDRCVARVRAVTPSLRRTSAQTLRADCALLFHNLTGQVLDFLIRVDWEKAEAQADGIMISAAQVDHTYRADTRAQFPTASAFRRFRRRTGETIPDVRFRVRVILTHAALLKAEHLSEAALDGELTRRFEPQTTCARFYAVSDCSHTAP